MYRRGSRPFPLGEKAGEPQCLEFRKRGAEVEVLLGHGANDEAASVLGNRHPRGRESGLPRGGLRLCGRLWRRLCRLLSLYAETPLAVGGRLVASWLSLVMLGGETGRHVLDNGVGRRLGKRGHRRVYGECGMGRGEIARELPCRLVRRVFPPHRELAVRRLYKARRRDMP